MECLLDYSNNTILLNYVNELDEQINYPVTGYRNDSGLSATRSFKNL